jgi:hypothetical protein
MAGYPTAVDTPNLSGTSIPTLYASSLLVAFYAASVFGAIATTEYEGQVKDKGDTLRIRTLPTPIIRDHVEGQALIYDKPEPSYVDLVIDKGKYWSYEVGDVTRKQVDYDVLSNWSAHFVEYLKIAIDTDVLGGTYSSAHASNSGTTAGAISAGLNLGVAGTPLAVTSTNVIEKIILCGQALDELNVPSTNRWIVAPAWFCSLLKQSDIKDASMMGDGKSVLRNGRIGVIDRFEIYMSNNLTVATETHTPTNVMFGWKGSIAFASQIAKTETLRNPTAFGDLCRSLQVYGYKVIKPEGLGNLFCYSG